MKYLRRQTLNPGNIFDDTILQRSDGNIELNPTQRVIINGDLVLGSQGNIPSSEVTNVMYVTMDGDDSNSGRGEGPNQAKRTIKSAVLAAQEGTTIFVRSGEYYEDNPIKIPPKVSIIGDNLRRVIIRPLNKPITYNISLIQREGGVVTITTDVTHSLLLHDRVRIICSTDDSIDEESANIIEVTDNTIKYRNEGPDFVVQGGVGTVKKGFDMFLVNSSVYIAGVVFKGLQAPAYCIDIDRDAIVDTSPYVQNCSNINGPWMRNGEEWLPFVTKQPDLTGTLVAGPRPLKDDEIFPASVGEYGIDDRGAGGGMLIDGDRYNPESPIKSMVADAFTQIAQGAVGFHIANMGYMQLVSCFSVFCDKAFYTTKGGYLSISNSVCDFGNTGFTADGYYYEPYATGVVANDYYSTVASVTINIEGAGYTVAPDILIDPPSTPGGTTATAIATLDAFRGTVSAITIIEPGSGYTSVPNVTISGGGAPSITAVGTANLATNIFIEVAELGDKPQVASVMFLGNDPTGYYISSTRNSTQSFRYNEQKCKRDVGYIVDAVLSDVALNTNHQSVYAGLAYLRSYSSKVLSLQKSQTIDGVLEAKAQVMARVTNPAALTKISDNFDIVLNILENGISGADAVSLPALTGRESGFDEAKNVLLANKDFIKDEITAWIAQNVEGFEYDEVKCSRDVGLIVEAVLSDMILGTTYNSVYAGLSYLRSYTSTVISSQKKQTIAGINRAKEIVLGLITDYNTELIINTNFDIITTIIKNGAIAAPQITYTNPVGLDGATANSVAQLRANRSFIAEEVVAYINNNLDPITIPNYNENVCKRDVGYLVDALIFDLLYNGNSATINAALSYYIGAVSTVEDEESAFVAAYNHLQNFIEYVILADNTSWTKSPSNALTQNIANPAGNSTAVDTIVDLIQIVIDVVESGTAEAPVIIQPTYSAGAYYTVKNPDRLEILSYLTTIQSQVIEFLDKVYAGNFSYNEETCKRDVGYILDAIAYDLAYGGNTQTRNAALAYAEGSVIAGEVEQTIAAYRHWKNVLYDVLRNVTIIPSTGNTTSQITSLTLGAPVPEYRVAVAAQNLLQIVIDVLDYGTGYVPEPPTLPQFELADNTLVQIREDVLADINTVQEEVILYLNTTYGGGIEVKVFPGIISIPQGTEVRFHNVSTISTGGTALEYVGSGVTYNALPFFGGEPDPTKERIEIDNGKCFTVTNDQVGNFKVGGIFNVNALTGGVTISADDLNLSGLSEIGPFKRGGVPVGVVLKEVSNNPLLVSSTGAADVNTVPTQIAVRDYVENNYLNKIQSSTLQTVKSDVTFEQDVVVQGDATIEQDVVVEGDVEIQGGDLTTNQTTFNLLETNATTVNAFGSATTIDIGSTTGTLTINNNQVVLNSTGSLQIPVGDTSERPTIEIAGQIRYNNEISSYEGYTSGAWSSLGGVKSVDGLTQITAESFPAASDDILRFYAADTDNVTSKLVATLDNASLIINNTTGSTDKNTGALIVEGGVGIEENLNVGGALGIGGNLTLTGDLAVNGGDITTTATTFNLINATATTVNFAGAATAIEIGAATGTTNINHNLDVDGDLNIDGTTLSVSAATFNLIDTTVTTVNFAGAATTIDIGATTGTTNVNNNLEVRGTTIGSNQLAVNLLNSTTTTVNAFGAATTVNIGANSGTTKVLNNFEVDLNSRLGINTDSVNTVNGKLTVNLKDDTADIFTIRESTNNYIKINSSNGLELITFGVLPKYEFLNVTDASNVSSASTVFSGGVGIAKKLFVGNNLNVAGSFTLGNTSAEVHTINGSLTVDVPDNNASAIQFKENTQTYFTVVTTNGSESVTFEATPKVLIKNVTDSTDKDTGALIVEGGVGIEKNLNVGVNLGVIGDTTFTGDLAVNGGDITTIATTFNLLNTTATTGNLFGAGTAITIGATTGTTTIRNANTVVTGDLAVNGADITTTSTGTATVFNANATTVNAFGAAVAVNLGSAGSSGTLTIKNDNTVLDGDLQVKGGDLTTNQTTFNLLNATATTINAFGAATTIEIGAATGTTNINNNLDVDGDVNIDGGDLTVSTSTFNLANTTATTVNFAGAGTSVNIGAATGTTNVKNNLQVDLDLDIRGGDITTNQTTFNLLNATATTVNAFGASTSISIGAATGTATINNANTVVTGDLAVNGSDITTSGTGTFNLLTTNATGVNFGLVATAIEIGAATGSTNINHDLVVDGDLQVKGGDLTTNQTTFNLLNATATTVNAFGAATTVNLGATSTTVNAGILTLNTDLAVQYGGSGRSTFTENGVIFGNNADGLLVTAESNPGSNAITSYGILTTDINNVPVWTDVIDGGSY
jgi:hypothetical protein